MAEKRIRIGNYTAEQFNAAVEQLAAMPENQGVSREIISRQIVERFGFPKGVHPEIRPTDLADRISGAIQRGGEALGMNPDVVRPVAEMLTPSSPSEVAIAGASLASLPFTGPAGPAARTAIGRGVQQVGRAAFGSAPRRIASTAAAGAAGRFEEDPSLRSAGIGALEGAGISTLGEATGRLFSSGARAASAGRHQTVGNPRVAGEMLEGLDIVPITSSTTESIAEAFSNIGRFASQEIKSGLERVKTSVPPQTSINSPALREFQELIGAEPPSVTIGGQQTPIAYTVDEAVELYTKIGPEAFAEGKAKMTRTGRTAADLRSAAIEEIKAQLPPEAAADLTRTLHQYGVRKELERIVRETTKGGVEKTFLPKGGMDIGKLQRTALKRFISGEMRQHLTDEEVNLLMRTLGRGRRTTQTDVPGELGLRVGGGGLGRFGAFFTMPSAPVFAGTRDILPGPVSSVMAELLSRPLRRGLVPTEER